MFQDRNEQLLKQVLNSLDGLMDSQSFYELLNKAGFTQEEMERHGLDLREHYRTTFRIWAEGRPGGAYEGQKGFLYEDGECISFEDKVEAQQRTELLQLECMNRKPVVDFSCVETSVLTMPHNRLQLETIQAMNRKPDFSLEGVKIGETDYGSTGGGFTAASVKFHIPELGRPLYVICNDECMSVNTVDYLWDAEKWGDYYKESELCSVDLGDSNITPEAEFWRPILNPALEYIIKENTEYFSDRYTFPLNVNWLPESIRQTVDPEYLHWLESEDKLIEIARNGVVVDKEYELKQALKGASSVADKLSIAKDAVSAPGEKKTGIPRMQDAEL